ETLDSGVEKPELVGYLQHPHNTSSAAVSLHGLVLPWRLEKLHGATLDRQVGLVGGGMQPGEGLRPRDGVVRSRCAERHQPVPIGKETPQSRIVVFQFVEIRCVPAWGVVQAVLDAAVFLARLVLVDGMPEILRTAVSVDYGKELGERVLM